MPSWYRELNSYHWFVLVVAVLGWCFDCLDQQLFVMARQPAIRELLTTENGPPSTEQVNTFSSHATSIFLLGWATGGLLFGVLGDLWGRARIMLVTILIYSAFTGLSALSVTFWDFALYRFLAGLGVGGEFAVGVALVAEVMPERARPYAVALLPAFSVVGNISAALLFMGAGALVEREWLGNTWRPVFLVGALPALLTLVIRRRLREPERWRAIAEHKDTAADPASASLGSGSPSGTRPAMDLGSYRAMFRDRRWRRHALVGLAMACSAVVGLWAVTLYTMDLVGDLLTQRFTSRGWPPPQVIGSVAYWKSITSIMLNLGAFPGMLGFSYLTQALGRRPAFGLAYLATLLSTAAVFAFLREFWQIFVLVPIMGFFQFSLFSGFAIYFPELFPTHLRSTGISFCYNVGRFLAALGPVALGTLNSRVFQHTNEPLRYAGLSLCTIFVIGLLVLPFAPETKGRPLPES